ncbi:hypothetical protein AKJ64_01305 [candidate division MSBL1 archaeon SCGC-AAA259E17]|uniref:Uncharacterized protein n=1 Tax=candidate division MSBL1 archaeon SCGC-AAA259E17 TaxID=1698263 RepID=A0A133UFZ0_9EURY|nr:hypothetical protein AKJ64_01305 [candidate division MSBL1 archaeon SCGC-AAA259E17]
MGDSRYPIRHNIWIPSNIRIPRLEYQDELARRFVKFGYEVEVGERRGPDIVVEEPSTGEPVLVVGAKAYRLRSRRGLSDKFDLEVERARRAEVPLIAAVKNKLSELEMFRIYEPEDLKDFTYSAPSWLVGEEATDEARKKEKECRRALRGLLLGKQKGKTAV